MKKCSFLAKTQAVAKKMMAVGLAVAVTMVSLPSTANAANQAKVADVHVAEEGYAETMASKVEPYLAALRQSGTVTGKKGVSLYYEKFVVEGAKGTVVISHGFTENLEKYNEMIYYFTKLGYSVYGMEYRGHGRSGRLGTDSTQVNVEKFDYYVDDLKTFLDQIVVPEATKENLYIFGHSMGGGVAARFLEKYTTYFTGAILSAPMLEVNTGSIPSWIAKIIAGGASITKFANDYVLGQGPYSDAYDIENAGTSSEARYSYAWQKKVDNEAYQLGGASYRWLNEMFWGTYNATLRCQANNVKIPVLLFQAGQDAYVGNNGQNTFAKYAKNCTVVRYENARHEMYFEKDEIQVDFLNKVFDFLAQ